MTETSEAREITPFPDAERARESDPLEGDWAEGLRAPARESGLPKPRRSGVQAAAIPATTTVSTVGADSAEAAGLRTELFDLRSLEALSKDLPPREAAPEVEAPEAWASAEEDQLASVPPPARDGGKEEVLLLSDAELAEDGDEPGPDATAADQADASAPAGATTSDGSPATAAPDLREVLEPEELPAATGAGELLSAAGADEQVAEHELAPAELLEPHEAAGWDAQGTAGEVPIAFAQASAPGVERGMHIEELVPEEVIGIDPWSAAFVESARAAETGAAEPSPWTSDLGGDGIDWAPALAPAPGAGGAEASAWGEPASNAAASARSAAWNSESWDAQTVHAASLPDILARSPKAHDWSAPRTDANWDPEDSSPAQQAHGLGHKDSPFAPLAPGASLSSEDDLETAEPEPELAELEPGDLEPLPLEEHDLLVPLEEASPTHVGPHARTGPLLLAGEHRVAIQTRGGQAKRGILRNADLSAGQLTLHPSSGNAAPEQIASSEVKAIFFMLAPGERSQRGDGARVVVTFIDGRSIEGERDGKDAREGFFVVPVDAARTNTRRIFVARAALLQIDDG